MHEQNEHPGLPNDFFADLASTPRRPGPAAGAARISPPTPPKNSARSASTTGTTPSPQVHHLAQTRLRLGHPRLLARKRTPPRTRGPSHRPPQEPHTLRRNHPGGRRTHLPPPAKPGSTASSSENPAPTITRRKQIMDHVWRTNSHGGERASVGPFTLECQHVPEVSPSPSTPPPTAAGRPG